MPDVRLNIIVESELEQELNKGTAAADEFKKTANDLSKTVSKGFEDATDSAEKLTKEEVEQQKIVDKTTKQLKQMAAEKKKAADPKQVKKLNDELDKTEKKTKGLSSNFKALGATILAAFGVREVINFAKGSIDAFREQERSVKKVEQAIISTNNAAGLSLQQLQEEASALQSATLFGDEQILNESTAQLLTFTNIAGEQFKRTQAVALDLATVLDGDLQGASLQLGKALNDPVANLSALSRSGIQFSKDQKATIKALAETNQLAEAQNIILDELERQYGGQAAAAAEADGGFTQLSNTFGDFQEKVGSALVESLRPFIASLKEFFENITQDDIDEFIDKIKTVGKVIAVAATAFLTYRGVLVTTQAITKAQIVLTQAFAAAKTVLSGGLGKATKAMRVFNAVTKANPIGLVVAGITAAIAAFKLFGSSVTEAQRQQKAVEDATKSLSESFRQQATEVDKTFNKLADANTTTEEAVAITQELIDTYPGLLDDLTTQEGLLTDLEEAQRRVNDAILDNIVAEQKRQAANELIEQQIKNQVAIANAQKGILDDTAAEFDTFSNRIGAAFDSFSIGDSFSFIGAAFGSEESLKEVAKIQEDFNSSLNENIISQLEEQNESTKQQLNVLDEVYEEAKNNVQDTFKDLQFTLADNLAESNAQIAEDALKQTEQAKKEAEKRRKNRIQEQNALFKLEQDFLKSLADLERKAADERAKNLEGEDLIAFQEQRALEEINLLEDSLKEKIALIELERQLTKDQLSRLSQEEKQERINAFKEQAELEEKQIILLNQLREAAISNSTQARIELEREQQEQITNARLENIAEQTREQELFETELLQNIEQKRSEFGDSEIEFERFKEEESLKIKQAGFDRRVELINAELELQKQAFDLEIEALRQKDDEESKIRIESLEKQKTNADQEAQNRIQALEIEQQGIQDSLDKLADERSRFDLAEFLGLTPEQFDSLKGAVSEFGSALLEQIQNSLDAQIEANDKLIDSLGSQIDDTEDALDREIAKREAGFASNIEGKEQELARLKELEEEALKERERLQKQQLIIDTVNQASGLISTSVNILKGFSQIPIVGLPLGIAAVASLFGFFIKAKTEAFKAAGFHDGGYTGDGNEWDVAGVTHKKEFVSTAKTTKKHRPLLEAMHNDDMPKMESYMKEFLESRGISLNPDTPEIIEQKVQRVESFHRVEMGEAGTKILAGKLQDIESKFDDFVKYHKLQPERWSDDHYDYKKIGNKTIRTKKK